METALEQKNGFVLALRKYLQSGYGTENCYTYGEGDFEGKKIGNGYALVRRDPNKPEDLRGFCFLKDSCHHPPQNETEILRDIHNFASCKNIESLLKENKELLTIKFAEKKYSIFPFIGGGYAGEISVYFIEI